MQKKLNLLGRLTLVVTLMLVGGFILSAQPVSAQAKFPGYTAGVQIANLADTQAIVSLTAYNNSDGNQNGSTLNDTIPANSSKTYFPISNVSAGFSGSIVVGSDRNVAGIVNILSSDFKAGGSYVGRSEGATTVLLPLLNKDNSGFTTWYSIQNANLQDDATVNVAYSNGVTAGPFTIKPGAARVVYQSQEAHPNAVFAGTITSNQPVVAAVIQESNKIIFAYTGFRSDDASTNPVFPLVNANNANYITGIQIQNAGTQSTNITLSYTPTPGNGTACTETQSIAPGASATFALAAFGATAPSPSSNCAKGAKFVGSARVTANSADQVLVGIGNQLLPGVNGEAYVSFSDADAGEAVVMPLIMDRNSGFFTGFNVQNVGTAAVNVTCTFQNNSRTLGPVSLQPGAALNDVQANQLADKYVGSAICTGGTGAKLVAVVNQLKAGTDDNFLVYEGVKR